MARARWPALFWAVSGASAAACGRARADADGAAARASVAPVTPLGQDPRDVAAAGHGAERPGGGDGAAVAGARGAGASTGGEGAAEGARGPAGESPAGGAVRPGEGAPADAGGRAVPAGATAAACPDDMVLAGSACVDRYEAHLVALDGPAAGAPWPHYQRPRAGVAYAARNAGGVYPQAYINRNESDAACRLAGKRLCALAEWQRACRGARATLFPYGSAYRKGACNSGKPHLLSAFFGTDGYAWKYEEHFNSPLLDQQPGYLARAGEYAACASDEGAHDLVGNVHEWVADPVGQVPLDVGRPPRRRPMTRPGNGIFMGGFFSTTDEHGPGCTFVTTAHEPAYHDYSVGFRCCRDPGASSR
jgi:hypothetical protein